MSHDWYFVRGTESNGPFTTSELVTLLSSSQLPGDTLVWRAGLSAWIPANHLPELAPLLAQTPPPLPNAEASPLKDRLTEPPPLPSILQESGPQVRPWPRYWARQIDSLTAGILLAVMIEMSGFPIEDINNLALGMVAVFVWVPVEALFLSTWGFTPGKRLLKVRVTDENGSLLDFQRALKRSSLVWFAGVGIGIPIVNLVTAWFQYDKLTKTGKATYDHNEGFSVHHQYIGAGNQLIVGLVLAAFIALIMVGNA